MGLFMAPPENPYRRHYFFNIPADCPSVVR